MSQIIELIKELRERTGAGMMDCKKALEENNLDVEASISWLREKGIAKQAKKASRIAADGLTDFVIEGNKALIIEVNSETDFVAKSEPFKALVKKIENVILEKNYSTVEQVNDDEEIKAMFVDATVKIGEKIGLRRFQVIEVKDGQFVAGYIHMQGKATALVVIKGGSQELAHNLAVHTAAYNPSYLDASEIPAEEKAKELALQLEIVRQDPKFTDKPQEMLEKIVGGKVEKHFADQVLISQEYLYDASQKVGAVVKSAKAEIVSFVLYQLGEGIEKKVENFAEEVAQQMK